MWHSIDPLAENYIGWSPYNYVANNPLKFIDPDGKEIVDLDGKTITYTKKDGWSDNATDDVKQIYASLMLSEKGQEQWEKAISSENKMTMEITR